MVGGSVIAGDAVGSFTNNFEFAIPASFNFISGNATATATGTVSVTGIGSVFDFVANDSILVTLNVDPSTFDFNAGDATAIATGTVTITGVGSQFDFQALDGTPSYNVTVDGVPDIVVNRLGSDVTIKIRNLYDNKNATIYKANSNKGLYNELATISTSPYVDSGVTGEPKYKAAFTFTGNIGGSPVTLKGQDTRSRYTKE